jgi:hypothetical protein
MYRISPNISACAYIWDRNYIADTKNSLADRVDQSEREREREGDRERWRVCACVCVRGCEGECEGM